MHGAALCTPLMRLSVSRPPSGADTGTLGASPPPPGWGLGVWAETGTLGPSPRPQGGIWAETGDLGSLTPHLQGGVWAETRDSGSITPTGWGLS